MRLLIIAVCSLALLVGCHLTRQQEKDIKEGAGTAGTFFGIPRGVTETVVAGVLVLLSHKHGQRRERRRSTRAKPPEKVTPNV